MGQSLVHHYHLLPVVPPRPRVLVTFECPFQQQQQRVRPYCALESNCPFGHQNEPNLCRNLRPIPERFCLEFLLNKCTSGKLNSDKMVLCEHGFHVGGQDLLDPEQLAPLLSEAILGKPIEYRNWQIQRPPQCVICLLPIPILSSPTNGCVLYGNLENCSHKFCSKCIIEWRTRKQTLNRRGQRNIGTAFRCPTCRKPSSRIMLWPVLNQYFDLFCSWFYMQKNLFKIYVAENDAVCVKEIENRLFQLKFNNQLVALPFSSFRPVEDVNVQPGQPIEPQSDASSDQAQLQVPLDKNVLVKFQCLFQQQDKSPYCSHQSTCPFGHYHPERDSTTLLWPLLQCYCLDFLLNKCNSTQLERLNPNQLVKCEFGFHPSPQDLLEPENFVRQVVSALQGYSAKCRNGLFKRQDCAGCSKSIPTSWYSRDDLTNDNLVGLFESCCHCLCSDCASRLAQEAPHLRNIRCVLCDTSSRRIILWPAPVHSSTLKAHLFKVQKECFGLQVGPNTKVVINREEGENGYAWLFMFKFNGRTFGGTFHTNLLN